MDFWGTVQELKVRVFTLGSGLHCPPAVAIDTHQHLAIMSIGLRKIDVRKADSSSARLAAKLKLQIPAVTSPQITEIEPPEGRAREREAASAVQEFRMANDKPNIVHFENCRSKDWAWPSWARRKSSALTVSSFMASKFNTESRSSANTYGARRSETASCPREVYNITQVVLRSISGRDHRLHKPSLRI